ncbi:MAG TPA: DNA repair protein RecO [Flavobacteriales bacterium]|nr:DNA repair protein RecO [Flavobacteriales bacterium]
MQIKSQAIVLQALKHQDNSLVLKLFTQEKGLITCFTKHNTSKKKRTVKWQLLDVVELDLVHSSNSDFYGIKEASYAFKHTGRYFDPYKLSMSYFVAETLLKAMSEKNISYPELYSFALDSLNNLEETNNIAMYPIDFILNMADIMGIKPKVVEGGYVFNLSEGTIDTRPVGLQSVSTNEVVMLAGYIRNGNFEQPPGKEQRGRMLQLLLDFLKYHLPGFIEIKSLAVLKEVLN